MMQTHTQSLDRIFGYLFVAATAMLVLASWAGLQFSPMASLWLLASGVLLLGLPHGALDPLVAEQVFGNHRYYRQFVFLALYLMLVLTYWSVWMHFPTFGLASFLVISAFHFGSDWEECGHTWTNLGYGWTVVTVPALLHSEQVAQVYSVLGTTHSALLVTVSRPIAGVAILAGIAGAVTQIPTRKRHALEYAAIVVGGLMLPPLVFFTCYFSLLHSPRHLLETAHRLGIANLTQIYRRSLPVVLATVVLGGLGYRMLPATLPGNAMLQIVFVGLASLTAPHMLLDSFASRQQTNQHSGPS